MEKRKIPKQAGSGRTNQTTARYDSASDRRPLNPFHNREEVSYLLLLLYPPHSASPSSNTRLSPAHRLSGAKSLKQTKEKTNSADSVKHKTTTKTVSHSSNGNRHLKTISHSCRPRSEDTHVRKGKNVKIYLWPHAPPARCPLPALAA